MKILVFGHWSDTGFGIVTQELSTRWAQDGYDVRVIAVNHRGNPIQGIMSSRVWPANIAGDPTGGNISHEAATGSLWLTYDPNDNWIPDVCLMISDTGALYNFLGKPRPGESSPFGPFGDPLPTFVYTPIEGDNLRPSWRDVWTRIRPIAMSMFGQQVIYEHTGKAPPMIYHGVDAVQFRPAQPNAPIRPFPDMAIGSKYDAKKAAGFDPNRLHILRADRLVERKQYHVLIDAMKMVWDARDDVDLVLHCYPIDDGLNLYEEVARLPKQYHERVKLINSHDTYVGLSREALCALYNAADVYVSPTGGEGFGLTLAEALACEVPVITTNYAAGQEVCAEGAVLVDPVFDSRGERVRIHSRYGMDWTLSDTQGFAAAIMRLLEKPKLRRDLGRAGRAYVQKMFSWDMAAQQFILVFTEELARRALEMTQLQAANGSSAHRLRSQDLPSDRLGDDQARRAVGAAPSGGDQ